MNNIEIVHNELEEIKRGRGRPKKDKVQSEKETKAKYYEKNKDLINSKRQSETKTCRVCCNKEIRKNNFSTHLKSLEHNRMEEQYNKILKVIETL